VIGLQIFRLSINNLWAFVLSRANDEKHITLISLFDDSHPSLGLNLFQRIDNIGKVIFLKALKNDCTLKQVSQHLRCWSWLFNHFGSKLRFFIKNSKAFGADGLSAIFLFAFALHLLHFFEELLILLLAVWVWETSLLFSLSLEIINIDTHFGCNPSIHPGQYVFGLFCCYLFEHGLDDGVDIESQVLFYLLFSIFHRM
jgi:hypothetical protein